MMVTQLLICALVFLNFSVANIIRTTDLNNDRATNSLETTKGLDTSEPEDPDDVCNLSLDAGPCDVNSVMFYYNSDTRTCEKFNYGGCLGNANKFYDYRECEAACHVEDQSPEVCDQPRSIGDCPFKFNQYFYNQTTNECESFVYTGCYGNNNRFHDRDSCEDLCKIPEDDCKLPADPGVGPYSASFYYYNIQTGSCETFLYKGTLGNKNRFYDKEECEEYCEQLA
ncbi:carboxypeptidase inhibitor SmCI-like [Mytilus galloprovincialis]|uniref:carboxypeptidase inhibitor SmCI-like n=1 Tax=Mytilus galloprovincialis TaxID=29158 RepID=UPI003F7BFC2F